MHLVVVMVFGMVLWRPAAADFPPLLPGTLESLLIVLGQPLLWWLLARRWAKRALRKLTEGSGGVDAAQHTYHRASLGLRVFAFLGFASSFYATGWPYLVASLGWIPRWSGLADLLAISPFFLSVLAIWHGLFPADRALREYVFRARQWEHVPSSRVWSMGEYLLFNARHQLLTVAVPMVIILIAFVNCSVHRRTLVETFRFPWAPDAILAAVAGAVFIFSPLLLKRIWSTAPLPQGPLRRRLEQACVRAGLRCRDLLVWRSHGMMINAAVMGLFPRVRYVLFSDALLDGLDEQRVEAVFGHEAGHIRHHHIQYFLLFALVSVLIVSGVMEALLRLSEAPDGSFAINDFALQGIGIVVVAVFWGTVFGWISRRFERQADVFGAQCASPPAERCGEPCGIHSDQPSAVSDQEAKTPHSALRTPHSAEPSAHAVCASGARIFVSALDRVAILNGIPHEERSWRHSSIGSRMRFLTALAGDPALAERFQQRIRMIKRTLWATSLSGLALTAAYMAWQPDYRNWIYQNTLAPLAKAEVGNGKAKMTASSQPARKSNSATTRRRAYKRQDTQPRERAVIPPSGGPGGTAEQD